MDFSIVFLLKSGIRKFKLTNCVLFGKDVQLIFVFGSRESGIFKLTNCVFLLKDNMIKVVARTAPRSLVNCGVGKPLTLADYRGLLSFLALQRPYTGSLRSALHPDLWLGVHHL